MIFVMKRFGFVLSVAGMLAAMTACSEEPAAPRTVIAADAETIPNAAGMAHGDHNPKYNGAVMMTGNLHLEVVANRDGHYQIYFSDEARQALPAAAVKELKLAAVRPGIRGEPVEMKINETGERWEGKGGNVIESESSILVSFSYQGERMSTDVPFQAAANELKPNP